MLGDNVVKSTRSKNCSYYGLFDIYLNRVYIVACVYVLAINGQGFQGYDNSRKVITCKNFWHGKRQCKSD